MTFDFGPVLRRWPFLAHALLVTILLSVLCMLFATVIGITVAIGRTYGGRVLGALLAFYVDTMRAVPQLVLLIWTYFALPLVVGLPLSSMSAAVIALSLHLGAYAAETVRAGLTSVRRGQMRAALALGMGAGQAIRTVILPQALIRMLPPFGSLMVNAVKDSAIASVIAVPELLRQSQVVTGVTYRSFEVYTLAMGLYFLLCFPVVRGVDAIYRRVAPLGAS